ncbi:MAG TPA: serine/threonine-protein kinase [Gemmataceae bacterium]|nr:serine/threonine-protein kinase [Gemmataceae bacterium]
MPDRPRRRGDSPADQYRRLWRVGPLPDLKQFLANHANLTPDHLLDVIEVDRTERWHRGDRVKAERYLKDYPPIKEDTEAALVLIYGEYYLRKEMGETPSLMEFIARFPHHARRLRDQVLLHEAIELGHEAMGGGPPEVPGLAVQELLGQGGMCSVYRAVDEKAGREVAVKVLDPRHLQNMLRVARFRREIGSLLRLTHPNIVLGYRTGESSGLPYLIMEYCPGGTLADYLATHVVPPSAAARILRDLAAAVEYAHQKGVIHRDLKPSNVLLSVVQSADEVPSGVYPATDAVGLHPVLSDIEFPFVPKLSDFGLAKCTLGNEGSITATRETLGTPCYMAPELTVGARDADFRTDVYGIGAILYELLTGRPPFFATSPMEVLRMVRESPPMAPAEVNPRVPPELQAVCLRCLEKEPDERFQTAGDVANALLRV